MEHNVENCNVHISIGGTGKIEIYPMKSENKFVLTINNHTPIEGNNLGELFSKTKELVDPPWKREDIHKILSFIYGNNSDFISLTIDQFVNAEKSKLS